MTDEELKQQILQRMLAENGGKLPNRPDAFSAPPTQKYIAYFDKDGSIKFADNPNYQGAAEGPKASEAVTAATVQQTQAATATAQEQLTQLQAERQNRERNAAAGKGYLTDAEVATLDERRKSGQLDEARFQLEKQRLEQQNKLADAADRRAEQMHTLELLQAEAKTKVMQAEAEGKDPQSVRANYQLKLQEAWNNAQIAHLDWQQQFDEQQATQKQQQDAALLAQRETESRRSGVEGLLGKVFGMSPTLGPEAAPAQAGVIGALLSMGYGSEGGFIPKWMGGMSPATAAAASTATSAPGNPPSPAAGTKVTLPDGTKIETGGADPMALNDARHGPYPAALDPSALGPNAGLPDWANPNRLATMADFEALFPHHQPTAGPVVA